VVLASVKFTVLTFTHKDRIDQFNYLTRYKNAVNFVSFRKVYVTSILT
jgi:hypothetical protein